MEASVQPLGASPSIYPQRVNANFSEFHDGSLRPSKSLPFSDKEFTLREAEAREMALFLSHVAWLVDLVQILSDKLSVVEREGVFEPSFATGHFPPAIIQSLLSDTSATLLSNASLLRLYAFISQISSPIPRVLIYKLRSSSLLENLVFDLSLEGLKGVKKRPHDCLIFQAVKLGQVQC